MHTGIDERAVYQGLYGAKRLQHPHHGPCFVCEGRILVEDALQAGRQGLLQVVSVLCTPEQASTLTPLLPPGCALLPTPAPAVETLAGFPFHRGMLACVKVPHQPKPEVLLGAERLLVLPRVDQLENFGLMLRTAAALGMDGVVVGKGPDLFERRVVRVSMGAAWKMPVARPEDLPRFLDDWRAQGGSVVAAALHPEALDARNWQPSGRTALVLGPEGSGLDSDWLNRCDQKVMLPMARGIDSLNVAAAAAILMFQITRSAGAAPAAAPPTGSDRRPE